MTGTWLGWMATVASFEPDLSALYGAVVTSNTGPLTTGGSISAGGRLSLEPLEVTFHAGACQAVEDGDLVAVAQERRRDIASDEACSAGIVPRLVDEIAGSRPASKAVAKTSTQANANTAPSA